jgi:hypothetical protein
VHRAHPGQAGQAIAVQAIAIGHVARGDPQAIVGHAGD